MNKLKRKIKVKGKQTFMVKTKTKMDSKARRMSDFMGNS